MDNQQNLPYLGQISILAPVDETVDNSRELVDEMWITRELSTASSSPQNYPQVYPQISPLLSTSLSTGSMRETPRETKASFFPNVSVLQTALMLSPSLPYY